MKTRLMHHQERQKGTKRIKNNSRCSAPPHGVTLPHGQLHGYFEQDWTSRVEQGATLVSSRSRWILVSLSAAAGSCAQQRRASEPSVRTYLASLPLSDTLC